MSSALLERNLDRADSPVREIGLLTIAAPAAGVARFLAAPASLFGRDGDALLWAPPATVTRSSARVESPATLTLSSARAESKGLADTDTWNFAGRGVAGRVISGGPDRVSQIRDAAMRLLASVRFVPSIDDPPLRLFGGFSFRDGEEDPGPWSAFGEASFVLPRFLYAEREGRAWLRAAIPLDEPDALAAAIPVLYRLRAFLAAQAAPCQPGSITTTEELARPEWDRRVARALDAMHGALDKVVLARRTRVVLSGAPDISALAASLPAGGATRFVLSRGDVLFAGATPERLVSLHGGRLRCDALGGSLPRGAESEAAAEAASLRASAKDGREHASVVEGIRGALAPLASSLATSGPGVRTLSTVHHLHTEVTGVARAGVDVLALVDALHPTPAVCGSPRAAARDWIAANEGAPRGWYAGPVGWLDASGEGSFCVALRCALFHGSEAWLYAGAGLVEGSDAAAEWRETSAKQAPMLRALGGTP